MENKQSTAKIQVKQKSWLREYAEALIIAFILALFIRTFIVQAFKIPSGSMENTLLVGDHILVNKFSYGIHLPNEVLFTSIKLFSDVRFFPKNPERGDIIVFKYPKNEQKDFIKRVIGLPGDKLEIRQQKVYINDKPLHDEDFAIHRDPASGEPQYPRDDFGPLRVPEDHLFVMGDNRENSQDSRYWGFLNVNNIRGKAQLIYWSWNGENNSVRFNRIGRVLN